MSKTIDIIRRLRALPMTQAEISRKTGIPQPRVCRWEAGNIPVGADDALRLQDLLIDSQCEPDQNISAPASALIVEFTRADGTRYIGPDPRQHALEPVPVGNVALVDRRRRTDKRAGLVAGQGG
jgi:transcriptional regulator with XRE-family HTH domain